MYDDLSLRYKKMDLLSYQIYLVIVMCTRPNAYKPKCVQVRQ